MCVCVCVCVCLRVWHCYGVVSVTPVISSNVLCSWDRCGDQRVNALLTYQTFEAAAAVERSNTTPGRGREGAHSMKQWLANTTRDADSYTEVLGQIPDLSRQVLI